MKRDYKDMGENLIIALMMVLIAAIFILVCICLTRCKFLQ